MRLPEFSEDMRRRHPSKRHQSKKDRSPAKRQRVTNATTAYGLLLLLCV